MSLYFYIASYLKVSQKSPNKTGATTLNVGGKEANFKQQYYTSVNRNITNYFLPLKLKNQFRKEIICNQRVIKYEFGDTARVIILILDRRGITFLLHGQKATLTLPSNNAETHSIPIYCREKSSILLHTNCTAGLNACIYLAGGTLTCFSRVTFPVMSFYNIFPDLRTGKVQPSCLLQIDAVNLGGWQEAGTEVGITIMPIPPAHSHHH